MTQSTPTVSVVMSVYNEADTIETAIDSILAQTYEDYELIIVDDGSTDATPDKITAFDDDRIQYHQLETNCGLPAALNHGLHHATGDYVARMDADEHSHPSRFERQVTALANNTDAQVVGCWYEILGRDDTSLCTIRPSNRTYDSATLIESGIDVAHGSTMMRRDALKALCGYREEFQLAQDYDLWLRMASTYGPDWVHIVPEALYQRRIDTGQLAKRPVQRLYTSYAKRSAKQHYEHDDDLLTTLEAEAETTERREFTPRQEESLYHYLTGHYLLQTGHRSRAIRQFLESIWNNPLQFRAWYRLGLTPLPTAVRNRILRTVSKRLE